MKPEAKTFFVLASLAALTTSIVFFVDNSVAKASVVALYAIVTALIAGV